ncbi:MAG: alpha/beta hydrolase [Victivallales bacterium]|nr:alpha/beta hydrolase [Victivallales bacterium]
MKPSISISDKIKEECCSFTVDNAIVKGIVTRPSSGTPKGGIIFSHGWSGFRSGPSGILTEFARAFAEQGYLTLRFDYRGRGESQGDGLSATLTTMADDLVAACDFMEKHEHIARTALCGLCSGGNVVIGTLKRIPKANNLLLLSVYPFSDGDAFGRDVHRTFHYLKLYWKKLFRADTWTRFFRGDVKLKNVFNVIFGHFLKKGSNRKKEGNGTEQKSQEASNGNSLPKAVKASAVESRTQSGEAPKKHLANLRSDLPGIMIYGTADPDATAAIKYYGDYISEHHLPIAIRTIDGANHNFSSREWRELALQILLTHLQGRE